MSDADAAAGAMPLTLVNDVLEHSGAKVLVAEDLPINQELVVAILESLGHRVEVVANGEEAVKRAGADRFDIILMDIQMPGIDGVAATRRIRALAAPHGEVPIVALTANLLPDQIRSYFDAGMNGCVAKPLRRRDLAEALSRTLGGLGAAAPATENVPPTFDRERFETVQALLPADRLNHHVEAFVRLIADTAALDADDPTLEAQVHKIVSQAGMLGWMRLSAAASDLEAAFHYVRDRGAAHAAFQAAAEDVLSRRAAA